MKRSTSAELYATVHTSLSAKSYSPHKLRLSITMLPPAQLILFGDQAVPYRNDMQKILVRKDSPLLAMLLADGHRALAREIVSLPGPMRPAVAKLASPGEMLDAEKASPAASCALDSTLVCLSQIAAFVS